jgi:hypothetical protein
MQFAGDALALVLLQCEQLRREFRDLTLRSRDLM